MMLKVLIADDHAIVREGLKQILGDAPDMFIVGEAEHGNDALRRIREEHWDVVLLDMTMPGKSGLDVIKQVKTEKPDLRILVLSMHPEDHYALRVLKAGAAGYITKSSPPEQLISAILRVARGGKYITQTLAEKLANAFDADFERPAHETLTDREFQIFNMLATGKTVSEIANELALSVKTVSTHRTKILTKMNLRNNAELMHYFMRNGLSDYAPALPDSD